jgi:glycosyltransferase involved in cell wall biosynthesis
VTPFLKTLLVIPCYRESGRLPHFLTELCPVIDALGGVSVLVVDDGSGANEAAATRASIETLRPHHSCLLPLLELPSNLGKGGAVYEGWSKAGDDCDWLAFVDADGSCSASETARLIQLTRVATLAPPAALFASRVKMLGRSVERQFKRHLLGRVFATLVSELLNIPVYDSQCGLKLVPKSAFQSIQPRLTITGFAFDVDLLVALMDHGTAVIEVPIDWHEEPGGKVHLLRDSWRMACDVWKIRGTRK